MMEDLRGCGAVMARIAYEALGMTDAITPITKDKEILKEIEHQQKETQRSTRARKTTKVAAEEPDSESEGETSPP